MVKQEFKFWNDNSQSYSRGWKIQQIIIWAVKGPVSPSKTLTIYKKFRHSSHQEINS